jgi:hypothetical protein
MTKQTLGILTVATNIYLDYWVTMIQSFEENSGLDFELTFHVFTNRVEEARLASQLLKKSRIQVHEIPNLGWPEATLRRFELINAASREIQENVLMHLDADMIIHQNFDSDWDPEQWSGGISLVRHPGFFGLPSYSDAVRTALRKPTLKNIKSLRAFSNSTHGSWETNPYSEAFVPRNKRIKYYCGATWMGQSEPFLEMVNTLAGQTRLDTKKNVLAVWHDESHLNKWASENIFTELSPKYCFAKGFVDESRIKNIIEAVDKGEHSTR